MKIRQSIPLARFAPALRSLAVLLIAGPFAFAQTGGNLKIDVHVTDPKGQAIPAAFVALLSGDRVVRSGETDDQGFVSFGRLAAGTYSLTASSAGFEKLTKSDVQLSSAGLTIDMALVLAVNHKDSVEVHGTVMEVEESASQPNHLPASQAKELPSRPSTVADVLPLIPGVVREPGGGLILSSAPEHRAALIVNSADVTDPATGQFGTTIPIDSVDVLSVYQTAYLAEYGRFTAGLVSVETKRGGDKWKWDLNDPLPEFRIRSYHLRGLRTATPRLNFEGPLIANKLFFTEGFEYSKKNVEVFELPFPNNQKVSQGINSFSQLDWIASAKHLVTVTLHIAPQRQGGLNMDYFNPRPTTADASTHNYTGTAIDRLTIFGGLLETRFSFTRFDAGVWGQSDQPLTISPTGNSGSYFADQDRDSSRVSGAVRYAFAPVDKWGAHHFKIGGYLAGSDDNGKILERTINVVNEMQRLMYQITFPRQATFQVDDNEKSFFGQDHWIINSRIALDLGVRTESQQISGAFRIAPRGGLVIVPSKKTGTIFRGGYGLFYDRVPLNVYGFNRYPDRNITFYSADGTVSDGPFLYLNTLGQNRVRFPFVNQQPIDGNFSPRSAVWSAQVEQPMGRYLKVRATYLQNDSDGLVVMDRVAPPPGSNLGAYLLEGTGVSRYRQFDVIGTLKLRDDRQLFFSYTRSHAVGDLNEFGQFLGTVP
ncbi:MAG TPA: carboxypeptidase regulatory-like domain-containing protein, partial [Bryobacteraceae bacterium]